MVNSWLPKSVGAPFVQNWLLMLMEQISGVQHVEKIKFCVDRNWSLHPGIIGGCAFFHRQLLKIRMVKIMLHIIFKLTDVKIVENIFSWNISVIDPKTILLIAIIHSIIFFVVNKLIRSMLASDFLIVVFLDKRKVQDRKFSFDVFTDWLSFTDWSLLVLFLWGAAVSNL